MLKYLYSKYLFIGYIQESGCVRETKTDNPYIDYSDKVDLERVAKNGEEKSKRRCDNIKKNIMNIKVGRVKKYQVTGYHEAKQIMKFCKDLNIHAELVTDDKITMNVLDYIYPRIDAGCCKECDTKICFANIKTPCMYVLVRFLRAGSVSD